MRNWAPNEKALLAVIRTLTFILSEMRKYWYILFGVETSFDHSVCCEIIQYRGKGGSMETS